MLTAAQFKITNLETIAPRESVWSLYLNREALPAAPGGFSAEVELADGGRLIVSQFEGETGWVIDGLYTAASPSFPVYWNGTGSRCTILRYVEDAAIVAALDARVAS